MLRRAERVTRRTARAGLCTEAAPAAAGPDLDLLEFLGEWEDGNGQALDPAALEQARPEPLAEPAAASREAP